MNDSGTDLDNNSTNDDEVVGFYLKSGEDNSVVAGQLRYADPASYIGGAGNDASFIFIPEENFNGYTELLYRYDETGVASTKVSLVRIYVSPVNDAPVLTLSDSSLATDEDTSITFGSTGGLPSISFTDVDATASSLMDLTLSAGQGVVELATTTGLTILAGGDGSGYLKVRGTLAALEAAVDGLVYTPNADYEGADTLSVVIADLGDTGSGGAKSDSGSISLNMTPVNDAPTMASLTGFSYNHDAPKIFNQSSQSARAQGTDVDAGDILSYGVKVGNSYNASATEQLGTLTINSSTGAYTFDPNDAAVYAVTSVVTQTFTLGVSDDASPSLSGENTVTITVNGGPLTVGSFLTPEQMDAVMGYYTGSTARLNIDGLSGAHINVVIKHLPKFDARDLSFLFPQTVPAPAPQAEPSSDPTPDKFAPQVTTRTSQVTLSDNSSDGAQTSLGVNNSNPASSGQAGRSASAVTDTPTLSQLPSQQRVLNVSVAGALSSSLSAEQDSQTTDNSAIDDSTDEVQLEARLSSGEELPTWVVFDSETQSFVATVPDGVTGVLEAIVIVRRGDGAELVVPVTIDLDNLSAVADDASQNQTEGSDTDAEDDGAALDWDELERQLLNRSAPVQFAQSGFGFNQQIAQI